MSYTPVYSSRINWENEPSIASPINATNLNKMDYALKAHDDTLANWDITKANESDLLLSLKSVDYDTDTGEFVFTWWNGTTKTVDLNIEKIPVSFSMSPQGVITMTTDDGTTYTADVGALIKTYTFTDSSEIDFTVTTDASGNKTITASIVAGSIDGTKLVPNYLADCTAAKTGAETAEGKAEGSAEDAEAWAVGTRGGVPVPSTDPAYENNAEYWAHHTSSSLAGLTDTDINNPQNGQVPVYNSTTNKWENQNQSAGGGSTITVTTSESALYGQNVTITDGVTTLTETFSNSGEATFTGVTLTGTLTLASGGASRSISIPYFGNYSFILSLFTATVTVTYPADASCTLSDGVTTLTGTGSPMAFSVPNAGTWTATVTLDGASKTDSAVITTDGQTASITIEYGTINVTYDNAFRGTSITCVQGGTTITKTAPSGANTMTFYPPTTGNWVISGTVSGTPYSKTANVTSLSTSVSVSLETVPDGKTATPTDDIEKWLQCGQITGKSYTTLSQVLDDAETYERLLSDSNACDYMARSTTWAVAEGQVPNMTSATTPSGVVSASGNSTNYPPYYAFNGNKSTGDSDNDYWMVNSNNGWLQYDFGEEVTIGRFEFAQKLTSPRTITIQLQGSHNGSTFEDITDASGTVKQESNVADVTFAKATYRYFRFSLQSSDSYIVCAYAQFFEDADITTSQDAMMRLGKYDYACDALLEDSTWCTAICGSTYFEYVLTYERGLVPVMTSNTTPSGECFGSAYESTFNYYLAFDNDSATMWSSGERSPNYSYVGYSFPSSKKVRIAVITNRLGMGATWKIQGSSDKSSWSDLTSDVTFNAGETKAIVLTTEGNVQHYRVYGKCTSNDWTNQLLSVQFYDRYEPQTDIIVTAHGGDTVYYMENGSPVPLTTADSDTGIGTVDWSDLPKGAITLYSSTAKNPSDLTADYSKTVYVTEYTTQIYLMPENTLYWRGYEDNNLEECSSANGWTPWSSTTNVSPTYNTDNMVLTCANWNYICGVGNKVAIPSATKIVAIVKGESTERTPADRCGDLALSPTVTTKSTNNPSVETLITVGSMAKYELDVSTYSDFFITYFSRGTDNSKLYALYYE